MRFEGLSRLASRTTIRQRLFFACAVDSIILAVCVLWLFYKTLYDVEIIIADTILDVDISHAVDMMDRCQENPTWQLKNGSIYRGEFFVGGIENVNRDSSFFDDMRERTNSTFFAIARCPEDKKKFGFDEKLDCQPGNFILVAGDDELIGNDWLGKPVPREVSEILNLNDSYGCVGKLEGKYGYVKYRVLRDSEQNPIGALASVQSTEGIERVRFAVGWKVFLIIFVVIMLSGWIMAVITGKGVSIISKIKNYLESARLGDANESEASFKQIISSAEVKAVKTSLDDISNSIREKKRIDSELEFAQIIQHNMMPNVFPAFPEYIEFDVYASMTPAKEIGGDFYDFFMPDSKHLAIVVADVSGKGVPAALFMVNAQNLIKTFTAQGMVLEKIFEKVNDILFSINKTGHFVTAWMGLLDITTGRLTYVNAGHNPPLLSDMNHEFQFLKLRSGFVLACMSGRKYRPHEIQMKPGMRLFLYTDGVTEAHCVPKAFYGEERLQKYLNLHFNDSLENVLKGLKSDVDGFVGTADQYDDMTMLMVEYRGGDSMQSSSKSFCTKLDELPEIKAYVKEILEKTDCPARLVMKMLLVVEEIFVNVVNYAYPEKEGMLEFEMITDPENITMVFRDCGVPFDPLSIGDPVVHGGAASRDAGGLGIFLTKKVMDNVGYNYVDGKNVLSMTKSLRNIH